MTLPQDITVEGKITSVRDGESRINQGFTYGYRVLEVMSNKRTYSVLINTGKFNDYGFIPKEGFWVHIEGKLYESDEYMYPSIKRVKVLKHIEEPATEKILKKLRSG